MLDWLLIFGHWGLPAMGIKGAALASTISEGISLLFFVIWAGFTADKKYGLQKPVIFALHLDPVYRVHPREKMAQKDNII